jgi:hypothetical protein
VTEGRLEVLNDRSYESLRKEESRSQRMEFGERGCVEETACRVRGTRAAVRIIVRLTPLASQHSVQWGSGLVGQSRDYEAGRGSGPLSSAKIGRWTCSEWLGTNTIGPPVSYAGCVE